MRERHGADLEIVMRTYTEKPRTEVDWKGFAYDPFLDGSSRISVGLVATRMLMAAITALGVPVAAEPLNALTPQYVDGLVTYNGVGARNVTDQTARERVSGFSSVVGFKNSPEGSIDVAVSAVISARSPHDFLGVDRHGVAAQLAHHGQRHRARHPARRRGRTELLGRARRRHQAPAGRPRAARGARGGRLARQQPEGPPAPDPGRARPGRPGRRRRAGHPRGDGGEQPRGRSAGPRPRPPPAR